MRLKAPWTRYAEKRIAQERPKILGEAYAETLANLYRTLGYKVDGNAQQTPIPTSYPQRTKPEYPIYHFDRPTWWATPTSPRRRPDSQVDWDTIRKFAKNYDIARSCINHLKREVQAQELNVTPRDKKDKSERTIRRVHEATLLLNSKGGVLGARHQNRRIFEMEVLEDLLVTGCMAVFKNKDKAGRPINYIPIDSVTIRPRTDAFGWPGPGEALYEQWIMGVVIGQYDDDELFYTGQWPETQQPYFISPIEYLITTIIAALKVDGWNRTWLTEGTTPSDMLALPENWTPEQIIEFTEFFTSLLAGNSMDRQRTKFVPSGTTRINGNGRKDQDFKEYELFLARRTAAVYGVQLTSIGFTEGTHKASHEDSNSQTTQFGAGTLLTIRKEHYDEILEESGYGDLEVSDGTDADEAPKDRDMRLGKAIQDGLVTINEAKAERGDDPVENGDNIILQKGATTLDKMIETPIVDPNAAPSLGGPKPAPRKPTAKQKVVKPKQKAKKGAKSPQKRADLAKWSQKCLNRLKAGRKALCEFESELIDEETETRVMASLSIAITPEEIRDIFRAEEEDDEDEDVHKKRLILILITVMQQISAAIAGYAEQLAAGEITASQFVEECMKTLTDGHVHVAWLGRLRAQQSGAINATDRLTGANEAETQRAFLQGFADDIAKKRVSEAQRRARAEMYAWRLVGTANKSWAQALPTETQINWIDTGDEKECADCEALAAGGPYTAATLPSFPGDGSTECLVSCRCYLETMDGETSFYDPEDGDMEI